MESSVGPDAATEFLDSLSQELARLVDFRWLVVRSPEPTNEQATSPCAAARRAVRLPARPPAACMPGESSMA